MQSPVLRDRDEVRRELGVGSGKFVLVTAGGGGDGYDLMKTYLKGVRSLSDSAKGDPERAVHSVLILGPDMPLHKRERLLQKMNGTTYPVKILDFSTEILNYMNAADLVVSMGGYNTVCEILTLEKPAIVIPRVRPVTEQWIRTRRMQALGLVDMIHPEKLTPEVLSGRVMQMLFDGTGAAHGNPWKVLDTDGLPSISRFVAAEVRARSAP
jgi:predicted glycosyltransferase